MVGIQRFFGNDTNILPSATISASSVLPASGTVFPKKPQRAALSNGIAKLLGSYTGHNDAEFSIKITDESIGTTPQISTPIFSGKGNGTITNLSATGLPSQKIKATLLSTGNDSAPAQISYLSGTMQAKADGDHGNYITITVTDNTTRTPGVYATPETIIAKDTESLKGEQFNFGNIALDAQGNIQQNSPRVSFGDHKTVHRLYKEFVDGEWVYSISPKLPNAVAAKTTINNVTSNYDITIKITPPARQNSTPVDIGDGIVISGSWYLCTQAGVTSATQPTFTGVVDSVVTDGTAKWTCKGVDTESYNGVTTDFDWLSNVNSNSSMVTYTGVLTNDLQPNGLGIIDVRLITQSYYLPVIASGSEFAKTLDNVSVSNNAPTQINEITCVDNTIVGEEIWDVNATVDGELSQAKTGIPYSASNIAFTIPQATTENNGAEITARFIPAQRGAGESIPSVCINHLQALRAAKSGTYKFIYRQKPGTPCQPCNPSEGNPASGPCAGLEPQGVAGVIPISQQIRQNLLTEWLGTANGNNILLTCPSTTGSSIIAKSTDLEMFQAAYNLLLQLLIDLHTNESVIEFTTWSAGATVSKGDTYQPLTPNSHAYRALKNGTTGGTEPTFPTNGGTVTDGTTEWQDIGVQPLLDWDTLFSDIKTELALLDTSNSSSPTNPYNDLTNWQANKTYIEGDSVRDTGGNGHKYSVVLFNSKISERLQGETINIGDYRQKVLFLSNSGGASILANVNLIATSNGTTDLVDDMFTLTSDFNVGDTITDGTVTWEIVGRQDASTNNIYVRGIKSGSTEPTFATDGTITNDKSPLRWSDDGDINATPPSITVECDLKATTAQIQEFFKKYIPQADNIRSQAQFSLSPKSDANTLQEVAECWQDEDVSNWWEYSGKQGYLPAFTGKNYYSVIRDGNGNIVPTFEFYFHIAVSEECKGKLIDGDEVEININGVQKTYQINDKFTVQSINAQPLQPTGGNGGDNLHTWGIVGTVTTGFANYIVENGNEALYSSLGLQLKILRGLISNQVGDNWTFAIEGGKFQFEVNNGGFSSNNDITSTPTLLQDGISASFIRGKPDSFNLNDQFDFTVKQPNSPDNIKSPNNDSWSWSGSSATITFNNGTNKTIDSFVIAQHNMPTGTTLLLEGGNDGLSWPNSETITYNTGVIAHLLATSWNNQYLRLTISNSTGGSIGWMYAGDSTKTTYNCKFVPLRNYKIERNEVQGHNFIGKQIGGTVSWTNDLKQPDIESLIQLIDHHYKNNEPFVFLPHELHPDEAMLVNIDTDSIEISDHDSLKYQGDDKNYRNLSLSIPLIGVLS